MSLRNCERCGRRWGGAALKVALLALPAAFWAAVFASLAGARAFERLSLIAEWGLRMADAW